MVYLVRKLQATVAFIIGFITISSIAYADDVITTEYEIMKINRDKKGNVTYSGVEDEELYKDLSEAATEHLETKFIF